ncbi:ubiquitin family protein Urm1 [Schizosaccharomyces cryophilus OY26]|uniref:Ubiquitin-related modifier 1 n=1 Tax=Schizosaccharomyces cryophilus (strain OY26 / ATCC MYA-4695 / CBS 11777 / NBRC 106824 / NRRL Y48691) TaxID=653667 RepID=S9X8A1_SCHCR|nr:ubiquitin family protein Urm1 [Schizosaccharomyces cryophilus OY26]EPY50046.1 ubiquitin family protein Urm1 [Schizosaccharomyces cryophilus OY26]
MAIKVELLGGLDMLFRKQKELSLELAELGEVKTLRSLIHFMAEKIESPTQKELFYLDGTVRPGIIVLVNDQDWELLDKEDYNLEDKDQVVFVSTLHGG